MNLNLINILKMYIILNIKNKMFVKNIKCC